MDTTISQGEVLRSIQKVKDYLLNHQEDLADKIYEAMNAISETVLAYRQHGGALGWAENIPGWSPQDATSLEEMFPVVAQQAGGAFGPSDLQFKAGSDLIKPTDLEVPSIDEMAESVQSYLAALDEKNRALAAAIGPVALVRQMEKDPAFGPVPPYLPVRLQLPARTILPLLNSVLETCRILASNYVYDSSFLRKILSVVLAIFDISRGEWRDGVFSLFGLFGSNLMFVGMLGKTARWVYNFISPDLQRRLESDLWAGSKSMIAGYWLWLASVVSPDFVRATINQMLEKAKAPLKSINEKIDAIEKQAQAAAQPIGFSVQFPRVPLDQIPSFDDIQNFQSLLHHPEIYCTDEFQALIQPVLSFAVIRVMFELLNIPVTSKGLQEACQGVPTKIQDAILKAAEPKVVPLQSEPKQTNSANTLVKRGESQESQDSQEPEVSQEINPEPPKQDGGQRSKRKTRRKTRRRSMRPRP